MRIEAREMGIGKILRIKRVTVEAVMMVLRCLRIPSISAKNESALELNMNYCIQNVVDWKVKLPHCTR